MRRWARMGDGPRARGGAPPKRGEPTDMSKEKKVSASKNAPAERRDQAGASGIPPSGFPPLWVRAFVWCVFGAAGILVLWGLTLATGQAVEASRLAEQGWGQYAPAIVGNKIRAVWHAAFMAAVVGVALWWMAGRRRLPAETQGQGSGDQRAGVPVSRHVVACLLVLVVAADAWWLSRNYIKTMSMSALDGNPVVELLKKDMPEHRVALVSQDGFYNWWLTYLFPYHGILAVNITQMPRMPADYKAFLGAVSRNPLRLWQLAAVGHVLAPASVWQQVQHDPAWSNAFELVYGYNVAPAEAGVTVVPVWAPADAAHSPREPVPASVGQHVVLRLLRPAPRFALIGAVRRVADADALRLLASPTYELWQDVLMPPAGSDGPTSAMKAADEVLGTLTNTGIVGTCRLLNYRAGRMEVEVKAAKPAVLRVSERFDKDWRATVDGAPVPVQRVDYIMQGVVVPSGEHRVVLRYAPAVWPLYVQGAGMLIVVGAILWLAVVPIWSRRTPAAGN